MLVLQIREADSGPADQNFHSLRKRKILHSPIFLRHVVVLPALYVSPQNAITNKYKLLVSTGSCLLKRFGTIIVVMHEIFHVQRPVKLRVLQLKTYLIIILFFKIRTKEACEGIFDVRILKLHCKPRPTLEFVYSSA